MSASTMIFRGGPKDGEENPTKEGFPAPDGYISPPDEGGDRHFYERVSVEDGGRHIYDYQGLERG